MKISNIKFYDGAQDKVCRLGLAHLFLELQQIILETQIHLLEEYQQNSGAVVREALDAKFVEKGDWQNTVAGGIDWIKRIRYNLTIVSRMGVEVQVSARSDLVIRDIVHLRNSIQEGEIDVGVIVVPNERLKTFLPSRTLTYRETIKYIEEEFKEAMTFPLIVVAIEHDGPGKVLPKKPRKR